MGRTACTEPQCLYKGALYLLPERPTDIITTVHQIKKTGGTFRSRVRIQLGLRLYPFVSTCAVLGSQTPCDCEGNKGRRWSPAMTTQLDSTSELEGELPASRPDRFTPGGKDPRASLKRRQGESRSLLGRCEAENKFRPCRDANLRLFWL